MPATLLLAALHKERLALGMEVDVHLADDSSAAGVVYSLRGEENVVVLLNLMSRQVKTTVPLDQVTPR